MAECKYCNRSSWFLSFSDHGLCGSCEGMLQRELGQRFRIIGESEDLINSSKVLETQLLRCDVIIEHANAMIPLEQKGIVTTNPPPSKLIGIFQNKKDELVVRALKSEIKTILEKIQFTVGVKTKVAALSKALLQIRSLKSKVVHPILLDALESQVKGFIHKTQLDSYLEQAKKAEFKGQNKKALDQYYEALYFLKNDAIPDATQKEQISFIEGKITELGGDIKIDKQEGSLPKE